MTLAEAWSQRRSSVDYFRIFGCIAYAHIPEEKRQKLDDKGEKCIFLGVSDQSKAYKLYNPSNKKIIVNRDVFYEEKFWPWINDVGLQIPTNFDGENEYGRRQPMGSEQLVPTTTQEERSQRARRRPAWMTDYEVARIDQFEDPLTHFALFSDCDPATFEAAIKESKWRKAMDEEIATIERNNN